MPSAKYSRPFRFNWGVTKGTPGPDFFHAPSVFVRRVLSQLAVLAGDLDAEPIYREAERERDPEGLSGGLPAQVEAQRARRKSQPVQRERNRARLATAGTGGGWKGTAGAQSALMLGVQSTGRPPKSRRIEESPAAAAAAASPPELRVATHPPTRMDSFPARLCPPPFGSKLGASATTRPAAPRAGSPAAPGGPSSNRMSATSAGTAHVRRHTSSAARVLTNRREPHCPSAPRFSTREPMVTYSR
eukprot:CAMPEP_0172603716 /NCGR_PEP_ID=MMETSP1068-20121228/23975_1 /TAXON_ID=35684 /ORGANISM="Pseudopedinella elastica, Strain CCMP716" /LENGTH=244 /DNA_ID=CAMNT_0013405555 /DNA_START=127 /DNA_END=862 /DNA_ORIENTATION=+